MGVRTTLMRVERSGLTGPAYEGWTGKLRYAFESLVFRREHVFALEAAAFPGVPVPDGPELGIRFVTTPDEYLAHEASIDRQWYAGFARKWVSAFGWGERAVIALEDDQVVGFSWLQRGEERGYPHYYGRLFEGEWRILRQAVAPGARGRGVHRRMTHAILGRLFADGAVRVFIECYENNVPSRKTFARVGFRPIATLEILELPLLGGFVRWKGPPR